MVYKTSFILRSYEMAGVVVGAVLGTVAVVQANKNPNKARQGQEKALE